MHLLYMFLNVLIIGLFLYSKLLPYKDRLDKRYIGIFGFFNSIFTPVFNFLKKAFKPVQVGIGLSVDMTQILLLVILLVLLNILK